jgi:hypothetical protein
MRQLPRAIAIAVLLLTAPSAGAATIDFEGLGLSEGTTLTTLLAHPDVSFSGVKLVLPGNPTVAFNGNSTGSGVGGPDNANSGATASQVDPALGSPMIVTFAVPVGGLSLEAVDIEVASVTESARFRVYDTPAGGMLLQTVVVTGGDPGTGDGLRKLVVLSGFAGDTSIRRLEIVKLAGPVGTNPGWAIDNITYGAAPTATQGTRWGSVKAEFSE